MYRSSCLPRANAPGIANLLVDRSWRRKEATSLVRDRQRSRILYTRTDYWRRRAERCDQESECQVLAMVKEETVVFFLHIMQQQRVWHVHPASRLTWAGRVSREPHGCPSTGRRCGPFWSFSRIHASLSGGFCIWRSFHLPAAKAATDDVWNTGSSMSRKRPNPHQPILHWAAPYHEIPPPTIVKTPPNCGKNEGGCPRIREADDLAEESWRASTRRLVQEDTRGRRKQGALQKRKWKTETAAGKQREKQGREGGRERLNPYGMAGRVGWEQYIKRVGTSARIYLSRPFG